MLYTVILSMFICGPFETVAYEVSNLENCRQDGMGQKTYRDSLFLGDKCVIVVNRQYGLNTEAIYLNIHENEQTSINVLNKLSKRKKLNSFYLEHSGNRRIEFAIDNDVYTIDPNRIFTDIGIKNTLHDGGSFSDSAFTLVKEFRSQLVKKITHSVQYVVTLHNNTPDNYSILSYKQGGNESDNTKEVYINSGMDPDDFVYTTDTWLYEQLVKEEVNVILQDNLNAINDGSLSVFCGSKFMPYVNIETEHGHYKMQRKLLLKVRRLIRKRVKS